MQLPHFKIKNGPLTGSLIHVTQAYIVLLFQLFIESVNEYGCISFITFQNR